MSQRNTVCPSCGRRGRLGIVAIPAMNPTTRARRAAVAVLRFARETA